MRCPNCNQLGYQFPEPCPHCHFNNDKRLDEELAHVDWLLTEIDTWEMLSRKLQTRIHDRYVERKRLLEIGLGLRLPPFSKAEARKAWPKLIQYERLRQQLVVWLEAGLLDPVATQITVDQAQYQIDEFREQLEGHRRPSYTPTKIDQLNLTYFLLEVVEQISENKGFVSLEAEEQIRGPLLAEQEQLEIQLGLRPEPVPEPVVEEVVVEPISEAVIEPVAIKPETPPEPELAPTPPEPAAPRLPFRERLWQVLLSERTLQAILVLGTFLLFSAALSFVAWGWKDFSAPVRVAIPAGFTVLFFAFGWYVRTKTPMYRSGIALSAIAALLIPINFYTIYVNFHIPFDYWPFFWFITSATCLIAYIITTLIIRSRFFGYLVGTAAGSTVLALIEMGHQAFNLSLDWRSAGLSALALGLIILATAFAPPTQKEERQSALRIFAGPFRYISLLTISVIMLLTFGWRFTQRDTYDTLHYALTINWWLGGFIFGWGAIQYRSRGLGLLAAITLPVATYLAQAAIFNQVGVNPAWHAFGWALLVPLYFIVGHKLSTYKNDDIIQGHGRTAIRWGVVLLFVAAFWSLTDLTSGAAAASSHAVLAGAVVLATLLWRRPVYLYGASMLSFSASSFAMTELNLTVAQLSVGWASLAIAHIIIAFNVGTRFPIPTPDLARPLVIAGYLIAAVALLPTLFPYDGSLLAYALGNWLALAAWGARLAYIKQPGFVGRGVRGESIFHWFTVIPLPFWLWILFTNYRPLDATFPLALAVLAWGMILLSYRLGTVSPVYRRPWFLTGGLISIVAPATAFAIAPDGFAPGLTLLAVGLLYFADAITNRQAGELVPAGLVTAWGYTFILNRLHLPVSVVSFGLAGLIAIYVLAGLWTERRRSSIYTKEFLLPLYITSHLLTLILLDRIFVGVSWTDATRLWGAASLFLLTIVYGLYAWGSYKELWGHFAAWFAAIGSGLVAITYSTARGSMVAELAIVAIVFILVERGLYRLRNRVNIRTRQQAFIRLTWRLFKRPLLTTGWIGSLIVIMLSLFYNITWLGGYHTERIWAVVALSLITALYGLSARLFQQTRFVWLAAVLSFVPWTILASLGWFTTYQPTPALYSFSWGLLAWTLFVTHLSLKRLDLQAYALVAPRVVMHLLLGLSIIWSSIYFTPFSFVQALALLVVGLLYFADAIINRHSLELSPGILVSGWGYIVLLEWFNLRFDTVGFALTLLTGFFILCGLWVERKKSPIFTHHFLAPLYLSAHVLTLAALWQVYIRPFDNIFFDVAWSDNMRLWGAAGQLVLGIVYGLYAWGTFKERWGHFAAWLFAFSGTFIAITYSSGRGSSAAKVAIGAIIFILIERGLNHLRQHPKLKHQQRELSQSIWHLYRRPLLITGWVGSAIGIGLALIRNLLLLGGGQSQQIWAMVALWLIVGLYALSARLFRQARFLWLAAPLAFAPWTILTNQGWFTLYRPTLPGYALSWVMLAWGLLLIGLVLDRRALRVYARPLKLMAHILMPFSLLWGIADVDTSRFTFGLAVGFYGLAAIVNHYRSEEIKSRFANLWRTKYFYPALGLIPIWCIYLMAWLLPVAQREHYGLMFLIFGPLGMIAGQWLYRVARHPKAASSYALPAYLTAYISLTVGTLLVAHQPPLLALVLLFDALLMVISAWLLKNPAWGYPATILAPLSLLLTLNEIGAPVNRYGWWLIGLATIYLISAWTLRRQANLAAYATAPLITGLTLIAVGLPPSSLDQTGAFWGYGSTALLYAVVAFWLRQPLLLTPASGLAIVPYAITLQKSSLAEEYYGLALFPGAILAIGIGWLLDRRYGAWQDFPWGNRGGWFMAIIDRLLNWWALPLYIIGFGLAAVSPFFAHSESGLMALNFWLMMLIFGGAIYRFRLRGWMVATAVAGHFAAIFYLGWLGWWRHPDLAQAWLRFLPVTLIMELVALFIQHYRGEVSPLENKSSINRWSYPLYIILSIDIIISQLFTLGEGGSVAASIITLSHAILIVTLASFWLSPRTIYLGLGLGAMAVAQWTIDVYESPQRLMIALAQLALAYGLLGYGLAVVREKLDKVRELRPWLAIWELPLQRSGIILSFGVLAFSTLLGLELLGWTIRAIFGVPFRHLVDMGTVQMAVGVLGFLGLLYLAASAIHRWVRLGYVATGMLLTAWLLQVFYIWELGTFKHVQWYAIPVGLYLLGIAYMEWQRGHKTFARRVDYLAMFLMLGPLFWQTLLFGWGYALLLGGEGLASLFWGSDRRLRRFLYAGMVGVILAVLGGLLSYLQSVNQWIVFGIVGMLLVLLAIGVERKLDDIKSLQGIVETWE